MFKINNELLGKVHNDAKKSPRKRISLRLHKGDGALVQRMINCLDIGTYMAPHKHQNPDKDESFIVLRGRVLALEFDDKGNIVDHAILDAKGEVKGVEFYAGQWHTFIVLEKGSCVFECKDGPYDPKTDKTFPDWAPKEDDKNADKYIEAILNKLTTHLDAKVSFTSVVKSRMSGL